MSDDFDPFRELQLAPDAEPELVKAAFKALAKKYHPDRFQEPAEKARAEERMRRINEAQRLIDSGQYQPPSVGAEVSNHPEPEPPRVVPPPPPPRPPQRLRRVSMGPILAAFAALLLAFLLPKLASSDRLGKALELERQGRYEEALDRLNSAIGQNPRLGEAYFHRARLWTHLNQPERAEVDRKNAAGLLQDRQLQELEKAYPPVTPTVSPSPPGEAEVPTSDSTNGGGDGLP